MSQEIVLHEDMLERGLNAAREGKSLREISASMGCNYTTLCWFRRNHTLFSNLLNKALEDGWHLQADSLISLHRDNSDLDPQILRMLSDNIKWLLSRRYRRVYGESIEVTYTEKPSVTTAIADARQRAISAHVVDGSIEPPDPFD